MESTASPEMRPAIASKRAVIVEDEGMTVLQLKKILKSAGVEVVGTAPNGAVGVELALRERPDLILMDVQMPVMDGLEAARRILEQERLCVVIITAFAEEHRARALELGVSGYIVKPVASDTLLPELERIYRSFAGG